MRIIMLLLSSFVFVASAKAQDFSSYMVSPYTGCCNSPGFSGAPLPTDTIAINRLVGTASSTEALPLGDFASAADVQNLNGQIQGINGQIQGLEHFHVFRNRRGIPRAADLWILGVGSNRQRGSPWASPIRRTCVSE
jgi:hypothetical protein